MLRGRSVGRGFPAGQIVDWPLGKRIPRACVRRVMLGAAVPYWQPAQ
jgi:hypothetical protein